MGISDHPDRPVGRDLSGISCASATACTAVGASGGPDRPWPSAGTAPAGPSVHPQPDGADISYLNDVSCTSATACTAVGITPAMSAPSADVRAGRTLGRNRVDDSAHPQITGPVQYRRGLVHVRDGVHGSRLLPQQRWRPGDAGRALERHRLDDPVHPQPARRARGKPPAGVSCTSATACTAVGYDASVGTTVTLAERWNGTSWKIQSTPNPTGAPPYLPAGDLVHVRHGVHSGRKLLQHRRQTGDAGRALERHRLDDPDDSQPGRRRP